MLRRSLVALVALALAAGACSSRSAEHAPAPDTDPARTMVDAEPDADAAPAAGAPGGDADERRPRFEGSIRRIGAALRAEMTDRNWRPGCPVGFDDLRALRVSYWDFDGEVRDGPVIVHESVAEDVLWVFQRLFRHRFRIHHIDLARKYRPNLDPWDRTGSLTAAFNCRPATGNPGALSQHSYGWAIDINPLQNPYVGSDGMTLRKAAMPYRDRTLRAPGMIRPGSIVVRSFARIGWEWGGNWDPIKDYMHFSLTGR